ncbi:WXG100 family type VII secretion target [Nocardia sp. NPDC050175]|uniref:WXG100 family type VII secretion target n=1 Tax=Nocardia sp. NPDC050175 TaxID=3364317 RepID=UPI0037B3A2D5
MALTNLGISSNTVGLEASGIANVKQTLEQAISNLRHSVQAIDDAAQAVVKKGWQGDASEAFSKVAQTWHDEADQLNKRFDAFTQAVEDGSSHLQKMDHGA